MPRAIDGLKECAACHVVKAVGEFYPEPKRTDECNPFCKACVAIKSAERRRKRSGRPVIEIPGTKFCPGCKTTKTSDEFHRDAEALRGIARLCKQCIASTCAKRRLRYAQADAVNRANGIKRCKRCKEHKPIDQFHGNKGERDHLDSNCKKCATDRHFRRRLHRLYDMTVDEYQELLKDQNHVCYLCHKSETLIIKGKLQRLMVDHCHKTSQSKNFRRLLCNRCNISVGGLEHFIDNGLLDKAIQYLKDHQR